jgi:F0F1-type ATP synthase membrane subunit c/vacuolar-type H+-ATPase subunit K
MQIVTAGSYKPTNERYAINQDSDRGQLIGASLAVGGCGILGGGVVRLVAGAGASLILGQVVCLTGVADYAVNTSIVDTTHRSVIGVVVGGGHIQTGITDYNIITDYNLYGVTVAAVATEDVLIQIRGVCYGIMAGAYAAGVVLRPDTTTAGRLLSIADVGVNAGATAVTSSAANGAGTVVGSYARTVGKLLAASSGAGNVQPLLLTLGS